MIPEFIGRLPIIFTLNGLTEDMIVQILREPRNAILKQYQKLLALDEVKLEFEDGALHAIARKQWRDIQEPEHFALSLRNYMLDIMYEIPKDDRYRRGCDHRRIYSGKRWSEDPDERPGSSGTGRIRVVLLLL